MMQWQKNSLLSEPDTPRKIKANEMRMKRDTRDTPTMTNPTRVLRSVHTTDVFASRQSKRFNTGIILQWTEITRIHERDTRSIVAAFAMYWIQSFAPCCLHYKMDPMILVNFRSVLFFYGKIKW